MHELLKFAFTLKLGVNNKLDKNIKLLKKKMLFGVKMTIR